MHARASQEEAAEAEAEEEEEESQFGMTRPQSARGALNRFGTLAERLALIYDTVRYCHIAAETAGGDAILLSTWPGRRCIVLSQARLLPRFPAFHYGYSCTGDRPAFCSCSCCR